MKNNDDFIVDAQLFKRIVYCANLLNYKGFDVECECSNTKVHSIIENGFLFVECLNMGCEYLVPFGNSKICNSPKRLKIYKKYKI